MSTSTTASGHDSAAGAKLPPNYPWQVLGIVMIGTLMSALDSSIVNVAIPAIMADFGVSVDDIEWVVTGYMLAFATLMPLTAWLRDRVGHKFLYSASLAVFTIGSLLCGIAWNLPTLIFARVVQAIGGGALTPTGMAMITEVFKPHERGKALGFWGMGAVMGPAFGPTVGGYLTKYFGWPSIFLVNLPIGILGFFLATRVLAADKPHPNSHRSFDTWGFVFLSTFLISFLLGISRGESQGWTSPVVIWCAILAFIGLAGFFLVESLVPHGIIDLGLLKRPVFASCMILTALRSIALYGGTFLLPVFLQNFKGLDEVESGLILLPGSLLMGVLMPISGRLADRLAPRYMALVGFVGISLFFYQYRHLDVLSSNWNVIGPTLVRGFGIAMLIAPLTATAMNSVPKHKAGMASSMLNIIQQVGGSLGIAVLSMVLTRRVSYHLSQVGSAASSSSDAFRAAVSNVYAHAHSVGYSRADALRAASSLVSRHLAVSASVRAFQDAFIFGAVIVSIGAVAVFLLPSRPVSHGEEPIVME